MPGLWYKSSFETVEIFNFKTFLADFYLFHVQSTLLNLYYNYIQPTVCLIINNYWMRFL